MQTQKLTKSMLVRYAALYAALLFCLFSLVLFIIKRDYSKTLMSFVSILYVLLPGVAEKLCKFKIGPTLYVIVIIYAVCPLLGYSYDFYYYLDWWDDILHAFAGFIFAMLGAYLPHVLDKEHKPSLAMCAFSAFFFSVAISGLWELCEFSMDTLFGTDMQKDTELFGMRPSYLLSELLGEPIGTLRDIREIFLIIDGQPLPPDTYVDLGLIDTMKDIFVETLGAAVYVIMFRAGGGKNFVFERIPEETEEVLIAEEAPLGLVTAEVAASEEGEASHEETSQLEIERENTSEE